MIKDRIWTLVSRKFSDEATASELAELEGILQTQENADLYLQALEEFWKIPPEDDKEFLEATYHLHLNRLKDKGFDLEADIEKDKEDATALYLNYEEEAPRNSRKIKQMLALGSFLLVGIIFLLLYATRDKTAAIAGTNQPAKSEVSTKSGARTKIQLPDGTSVWLNGNSKLVYDHLHFGERAREVTLTGEAYFDVSRSKDKPFIIHADNIHIKVLGTVFNVKAYPGEKNIETSLVKGSIEVTMTDRKGKITMKPNDKLIVLNEKVPEMVNKGNSLTHKTIHQPAMPLISMSHLTLAKDENTFLETAWVENKLVFDDETFEEVALRMERWYGITIHFADAKLKRQRLTGTFERESIAEALLALQISTPFFKYTINNELITISK